MNFTDMHSHILPGLDDGAQDERESLEMLRIAAGNGIRKIIATPHFHYRRGHADPDKIRQTVSKMQKLLAESGISVELYAGNELFYTHELLDTVKAGGALTMADSDYVLLEFSPETERRKIQNAVYEFMNEGYYPILAHMERYLAFQKHPDFAESIFRMGAYFQVNGGSLLGTAGWKTKRFAKSILETGMVQFLATDAHDITRRPPGFGNLPDRLRKKYGEARLQEYLWENPAKILENQAL